MSEFRPLPEHDAFKLLTDSLDQAVSACISIGYHRPDQRQLWEKMAAALYVSKEQTFQLAGSGTRIIQ